MSQEETLRFGLGVDQVSPETALRHDADSGQSSARRIVNFDITNGHRLYRRKGSVRKVNLSDCHSLWADGVSYFVSGSTMYKFDGDAYTSVVTGLSPGFTVSYAKVAGDVYWSNGVNSGILVDGVTNTAWGATETTGGLGQTYAAQVRGSIIRHYRGRLYAVDGRIIWATDPMDYKRVDLMRGFLMLESEITLFEPVTNGIFVGTQNEGVRFLAGPDFRLFQLTKADDLPAVRGSGLSVDGATFASMGHAAIWLTSSGWVFGSGDGATKRLTDKSLALPNYESAASVMREHNGISQLLSIVRGGSDTASASDVITSEVIRNGVLLV